MKRIPSRARSHSDAAGAVLLLAFILWFIAVILHL